MNKIFKEQKKINYESQLVQHVVDFFEKLQYKVTIEVPFLGQCVDIVATNNEQITFIEAKISDWAKAIEQCKVHTQVADYIYIAIASVNVSSNLLDTARLKGIGIIHCNPYTLELKEVLKPELNCRAWQPLRINIRKNIEEIEYAY